MNDDTANKLLQIFRDLFKYSGDSLSDDVSMDNLEAWDSMQHLILVTELESAFGAHFTTDEILAMTNVGEIRKVMDRHLGAR